MRPVDFSRHTTEIAGCTRTGVAMKPVDFSKHTTEFVGYGDVGNLHVLIAKYRGNVSGLISCWKGSLIARLRFLFTGRMYICLLTDRQPPMFATTSKRAMCIKEVEAFHEYIGDLA